MIDRDVDVRAVLTEEVLEELVGHLHRDQKVSFDLGDVPPSLRALAPYAAIWGVADDWSRESLIENTSDLLKENIKHVVSRFDDDLDDWLAGPEASEEDPSDAYVAFSSLRMAADYI